MNDKLGFGALASPEDERDFGPEDLGGAAPEVYPVSWAADVSMVPVYSQGKLPACGGHAGATLYGILENLGESLSPRFVYALCKKIDGAPNSQGTFARAILQVLQKYGVCSDDFFPNDVTLPYEEYSDWTKIPAAAYVDGLKRRIGPYARLTDLSFAGIKNAIYDHKLVLILAQVGDSMWTAPNGEPSWKAADILPLRPPAPVIDGHFWIDYGYLAADADFRNSFGAEWGSNGNGLYGEDYEPFIKEAWVAQLPTPPVLPPAPIIPVTVSAARDWLANVAEWLANLSIWIKGLQKKQTINQ